MAVPAPVSTVPTRPVHIVFVGAGAVGCFYASRLHHPDSNIHVSLIGRSNYAALAKNGVHLETHSFGDYVFRPHAVFPSVKAATPVDPDSISETDDEDEDDPGRDGRNGYGSSPNPPREWDFVVVTTKALPDLGDDAATIVPLVGPNTSIVLIQNGVGVEAPYRRRFPQTPIVSAVTVVSAEQIRPGVIRQNRWTRLHLGAYTYSAESKAPRSLGPSRGGSWAVAPEKELTRRGSEAVARLADWWTHLGGIRDIEQLDEVGLQTVRWHKLCINAAFNPSAVLSGGRGNADMASDPELRIHLGGVMDEIWQAAPRILGRPFPEGLARPDRILASTDRNKGARPSMLLDWEAGRPLELEVIVGNPVRIARARGVDLPRMQTLYALLRSTQAMREKKMAPAKL
ncbi:2-dehydropantoate 2-reductase [Grosmannia clavigera kw1407]|uniref:2-dehydropantoate 2-reductase n=1 Tax=Grosmannia clavigera (strain kw1407 / UAMH 11150) TaxID=655863 RepID=F0X9M6_GROCL|nr:2-dehydropantoate 2-reductase [Grosmannia clavigera kw1407]EFX05553.1 2-dehydropantoate 2-reductase [Grosmannia clavigera kw1407]